MIVRFQRALAVVFTHPRSSLRTAHSVKQMTILVETTFVETPNVSSSFIIC